MWTGQQVRKLSKRQKSLLLYLWKYYLELKEHERRPGFPSYLKLTDIWGIPWRVGGSPAAHSAISRSIRRLEERGLVLRQNRASGSPGRGNPRITKDDSIPLRSTHILLLPLGQEAAKRLTNSVTGNDNRLSKAAA